MSYLDTAVSVNITATSATVSVPGTKIPAIIGYHTKNTDKIRTYTDLPGMVSDGFGSNDPLYLMAQSIVEQDPRPAKFKVIRGSTSVGQTMTFAVTDNTAGDSVGLSLTSPSGVTTDLHHTVGSETTAQVATAIAALVPAGVTAATGGGSTVTLTVTASGTLWYPSLITGGNFVDTTSSASPSTDLTAALLVDNDWYGISGEWMDSANIADIASWTESNKKMHFYTSPDSGNFTVGGGIFDDMQDLSYKRTIGLYSGAPRGYGATGWLAAGLVPFPGSYNFAYKSIPGDAVDALTPSQYGNITTNNGNFYISMAGDNVAIDGRAASAQFADLQIGIDGLTADIQESVGTLLVSSPRVPYTRKGMAAIANAVSAALQRAVNGGFLSNDSGFEFKVTIPDLADVAPSDKANRILRNVVFTATAQGAINQVTITGSVSV